MAEPGTEFTLELEETTYISDDEEEETEQEYYPRLQNNGVIQRVRVNEFIKRAPVAVTGTRRATIHGVSTDGTPQSLIIFDWTIDQRKQGVRPKSLRISIVFASCQQGENGKHDAWYDPHVAAFAPRGTYSLMRTTQSLTTTTGVETSVQTGFAGQSAGVTAKYELAESKDVSDSIKIVGVSYNALSSGDPDRYNTAEWNLFENKSQRSGLPSKFSTVVLLERRVGDEGQFTADFDIRLRIDDFTDAKTWLKKMFRIIPEDDPIIFDPAKTEACQMGSFADSTSDDALDSYCKFVMYKESKDEDAIPAGAGATFIGGEKV